TATPPAERRINRTSPPGKKSPAPAACRRCGLSVVSETIVRLRPKDFARRPDHAPVCQEWPAPLARQRQKLDSKNHSRRPAVRWRFVRHREFVHAANEQWSLLA